MRTLWLRSHFQHRVISDEWCNIEQAGPSSHPNLFFLLYFSLVDFKSLPHSPPLHLFLYFIFSMHTKSRQGSTDHVKYLRLQLSHILPFQNKTLVSSSSILLNYISYRNNNLSLRYSSLLLYPQTNYEFPTLITLLHNSLCGLCHNLFVTMYTEVWTKTMHHNDS